MKRFWGVGIMVACLCMAVAISEAAPAYGTKMPQKGQFFTGGQGYLVFERELEGDNGEMESLQHFMLLSYGVTDWFSIDMKGGAGRIKQRPVSGTDFSYPSYVGGGYGFRIKVYDHEGVKAVCGFQHISIHPYTRNIGEDKYKAVLDDWQFSFLASKDVGKITPYVGGKWSRMDYIFWKNDYRNRIRSRIARSIGAIVGVDIPLTKKVWLNCEGQFIDVSAVAASINISF